MKGNSIKPIRLMPLLRRNADDMPMKRADALFLPATQKVAAMIAVPTPKKSGAAHLPFHQVSGNTSSIRIVKSPLLRF